MSNKSFMWVEKYRPRKIEDYVFHDDTHKKSFMSMIDNKEIGHLLFSGIQGSGKTALAQILISALEIDNFDVLTINASDENSVDTMREKIKGFVSTVPMGKFKILHLEEADYISLNGQAILRRLMEDYIDTARFILTCNHENKVIPPIKSRCQHFYFKASPQDEILEYCAKILIAEGIKFSLDLLEKYVVANYPDIRKIVNTLQQNSIDGVLQSTLVQTSSTDYKFKIIELLETDSWVQLRKVVCDNVTSEEWEYVYRFLYENLNKTKKFSKQDKWEEGIVVIADHLYKHSLASDPEINFAACTIRLGQI